MRRCFWWAVVVGLAVLPFVVVVGHPWAVAATASGFVSGRADRDEVYRTGRIGGYYVEQAALGSSGPSTIRYCYTIVRRTDHGWFGPVDLRREGLCAWGPTDEAIDAGPAGDRVYETLGFGWPATSYAMDYVERDDGTSRLNGLRLSGPEFDAYVVVGGTTSNAHSGLERALPTRVVWSGLAINLAAYAVGCWGLLLAAMLVRSSLRKCRWARGVCGGCRYEVGDLAVCPECGKARPGGEA